MGKSIHTPNMAQEELGMGSMSSAKNRSIAEAWTCRELAEICIEMNWLTER